MKRRYFAVLAAIMLLTAGMTGCKSKPAVITPTEQIDGPVGLKSDTEPAAGDVDIAGGSMRTTETNEEGSSEENAPAEAASVPSGLEGELTPIQTAPNIPNQPKTTYPNVGDEDQQGEYAPPPVTAAVKAREDRPAAEAAPNEIPAAVQATNAPAAQQNGNTPTALNTKGGKPDGKLQITVETVEITLDELKAKDYTVDLAVTLDANPGIVYSEWGLQLDDRCTYEADSDDLPFATISFINEEKAFLWTAWSNSGNATTRKGALLTLHVKVPRDAKPGSAYIISYAPQSLAPAPHLWQNEEISYTALDEVGWTNGGILVK
ncbi:MAG: hypothetical protein K6F80_04475 [Oscillospiraceae bacterium]|nr:hypothetical protein [Oscillospiraceae bacterium]